MFKNGPGFGVSASQVKVLTEPSQYYDKLVSLVQGAERRISIASLYLGTGDKSENLVNVVKKRLHEKNGDVQLRVVLDHSRGTRLSSGQTSCSMLLPLVQDYKVNSSFEIQRNIKSFPFLHRIRVESVYIILPT